MLIFESLALQSEVVKNRSPPRGTILFECRGKTINWCCRYHLWAQLWYPYTYDPTQSVPQNYARRTLHDEMSVEGFTTNWEHHFYDDDDESRVLADLGPGIVPIGCMSTVSIETLRLNRYMRSTDLLWYYPCASEQRFERMRTTAIFSTRVPITKGSCRGPISRVLRQIVRSAVKDSCLRFLADMHRGLLRLRTRALQQRSGKVRNGDVFAGIEDMRHLSPLLTIEDLDLTRIQSKQTKVKKTWTDGIEFQSPAVGHTYLLCADGAPQIDLYMEVSMISI